MLRTCYKRVSAAGCVALWLVLVAAGLGQEKRGGEGRGDYYPLLPGAHWVWRVKVGDEVKGNIEEVVASVETINNVPLVRLETRVQGNVVATEHLQVTREGVFRRRFQGTELPKPVLVLRYPVKAGDSWKVDATMGNQRFVGTVTTRFEEVEVPLGKFKALVTHLNGKVNNQPLTAVTWFVEGIGKVKQILQDANSTFTLELERFEPGKAK